MNLQVSISTYIYFIKLSYTSKKCKRFKYNSMLQKRKCIFTFVFLHSHLKIMCSAYEMIKFTRF